MDKSIGVKCKKKKKLQESCVDKTGITDALITLAVSDTGTGMRTMVGIRCRPNPDAGAM